MLYDDLPAAFRALEGGWLAAFRAMPNGFRRPLTQLLFEACEHGPPWLVHALPLALHAAVALLTAWVARSGFGLGARAAGLAGVLMLLHAGGWAVPFFLANSGDAFVAAAALLVFQAAPRALGGKDPGALAILWLGAMLGMLGKESAVVLPGVAALACAFARVRPRDGQGWAWAAALLAAHLIFLGFVVLNIKGAEASYAGDGRLSLRPLSWVRSAADYAICSLWPFTHLIQPSGMDFRVPHSGLWAARLLQLGVFAALAVRAVKLRRFEAPAALASMVLLMVLPSVVVAGPPESRYLYPALPFACLGGAMAARRVLQWARGRTGGAGRVAMAAGAAGAVLVCLHVAALATSPVLSSLRGDRRRVAAFMRDLAAEADRVPANAHLVVAGHPHPEAGAHTWAYRQMTLWLAAPDARWAYAGDDPRAPGAWVARCAEDGAIVSIEPPAPHSLAPALAP
ncbi:MAG: hypothetical protein SF028_15360 [Candidatus Sumerlaeia bacterium]|nr:hypothetical protein [Candidatus Sumerlaeia bacterium]